MRYYPVSKWKLTGDHVKRLFTSDTIAGAEGKGRRDAATYGDQTFVTVVAGESIDECWAQAETLLARTYKVGGNGK